MSNSFESTVEVYCHRIELRWWDIKPELTPELEAQLISAGEERVKESIENGCTSGSLDYDDGDVYAHGWFEKVKE
jgi:hypothetical protein